MLCVTSSPCLPSPLVAPNTSFPFLHDNSSSSSNLAEVIIAPGPRTQPGHAMCVLNYWLLCCAYIRCKANKPCVLRTLLTAPLTAAQQLTTQRLYCLKAVLPYLYTTRTARPSTLGSIVHSRCSGSGLGQQQQQRQQQPDVSSSSGSTTTEHTFAVPFACLRIRSYQEYCICLCNAVRVGGATAAALPACSTCIVIQHQETVCNLWHPPPGSVPTIAAQCDPGRWLVHLMLPGLWLTSTQYCHLCHCCSNCGCCCCCHPPRSQVPSAALPVR